MTIRNIKMWPCEILTTPTEEVQDGHVGGPDMQELLRDMMETCAAIGGIGLAAPQIGVPWRVAVVNMDQLFQDAEESQGRMGFMILINPTVIESQGRQFSREGCLSIPGVSAQVPRPEALTVEYTDQEGSRRSILLQGAQAAVVMHEIDHLDGTVFPDHLPRWKRSSIRKRMGRVRKRLRQMGFKHLPIPGAE